MSVISNKALNCCQGANHIQLHVILVLSYHNYNFDYLVKRKKSISLKQHLILQNSVALTIIAPLLEKVISSICKINYIEFKAQKLQVVFPRKFG